MDMGYSIIILRYKADSEYELETSKKFICIFSNQFMITYAVVEQFNFYWLLTDLAIPINQQVSFQRHMILIPDRFTYDIIIIKCSQMMTQSQSHPSLLSNMLEQ